MTIPANDGIIAQEGLPFIGAGLIFSLGLTATSVAYTPLVVPLALLGWAFTFFCTWFFRNPERDSDAGELAVISPADGRVLQVMEVEHDEWVGGPARKISIFMSVFDVHVNRAPISGTVAAVDYRPGKFLVASVDKASSENEQSSMSMTHENGQRVFWGGSALYSTVQSCAPWPSLSPMARPMF